MDYIISLLTSYGYFILFPLALIEGPALSLAVGFLISLGIFNFFPALGILILGDLIPDVFYYFLGAKGSEWKFIKKYKERFNFASLEKVWHNHPGKALLITKFSYGISAMLLIMAGIIKIPFKKFISYSFLISVAQYSLIMSIGYILGNSYKLAEGYIKYLEIIVLIGAMLFIIGYQLFLKYARKRIIGAEDKEL
jgi:membrane protein DedA with SNARE-associated domain